MAIFKKKTEEVKVKTAPTQAPQAVQPSAEPAKGPEAQPTLGTGHREKYAVLKKPWISEKALMAGTRSQYVFAVDPKATKPIIKGEVERRYGVHVQGVNIVRFTGKQRYFRGTISHKMVQKKAVVTLRAGEKIDIQ